jgi:nucleotide-binding universal stress UspA family protein
VNEAGPAISRIVVGVDGSEGAARAVRWVASLASSLGCEVVAVSAYDWLDNLNPVAAEMVKQELSDRLEGQWTAPLRDAGVTYHTVVEGEDPRLLLLRLGEEAPNSLIVVGSRGLGAIKEVLLGSVANYLTHQARVPVVVIPAPMARPMRD